MKKLILIFVTSIFLISCGSVEPDSVIDGNYVGTYSITHNYGTDSAYTIKEEITFEFYKGKYQCFSDNPIVPPKGSGIYRLARKKIVLINKLGYTADVNLDLVLNGYFDYSYNGNELILTQENTNLKYYHILKLSK
jgi:hypothetical protein